MDFALPVRRVHESAVSRKCSELGVRCVVASLSIAEQIPKAARGRARTPKVRQLPDRKVSLLSFLGLP